MLETNNSSPTKQTVLKNVEELVRQARTEMLGIGITAGTSPLRALLGQLKPLKSHNQHKAMRKYDYAIDI